MIRSRNKVRIINEGYDQDLELSVIVQNIGFKVIIKNMIRVWVHIIISTRLRVRLGFFIKDQGLAFRA